MMFPITQRRLEVAHAELALLLVRVGVCLELFAINVSVQETEKDLAASAEYTEAAAMVVQVCTVRLRLCWFYLPPLFKLLHRHTL